MAFQMMKTIGSLFSQHDGAATAQKPILTALPTDAKFLAGPPRRPTTAGGNPHSRQVEWPLVERLIGPQPQFKPSKAGPPESRYNRPISSAP